MDTGSIVSDGRKTVRDAVNAAAPEIGMDKVMLPAGAKGALTSNSITVCLLLVGPTAFTDTTSALAVG